MTGQLPATVAAAIAVGLAVVLTVEFLSGSRSVRSWVSISLEPLRKTIREGHLPSVPEKVRLAVLAGSVAIAVGWFVGGPVVAAVLAALAPGCVAMVVSRSAARYRRAADRSLPDLARAVADALAAGQSPRGSLSSVAVSLEGEIGFEMKRLGRRLDLGVPTGEALEDMGDRLASQRYEAFVGAVKSQATTGGDLAALLRRLADGAAERDRVADDARTATAQARFTGYLVAAMPVGAVLFSEVVSPGLMASVGASVPGLVLVSLSVLMQGVAFVAIARIADIEAP